MEVRPARASPYPLEHDVEAQIAAGVGSQRVTEVEAQEPVEQGDAGARPDQRVGLKELVRRTRLSGVDEDDRPEPAPDRRQVELGGPNACPCRLP